MIVRASKLALRLVAGLLAALILLFLVLAWRLSSGPVSLGFLTPYVGEALSDRQAGFSASIGAAMLSWNRAERTLGIRAANVRLTRPDGSLVAAVPEVEFDLSLKALLHGVLAPTSVDITGVRFNAVRESDGRIDIGLGAPVPATNAPTANTPPANTATANTATATTSTAGGAAPPGAAGPPAAGDILDLLVHQLTTTDPNDPAAYLTRARIRNAALTLDDKRLGILWRAPEADLILSREPNGVLGRLHLGVELEGKLARLVGTLHIARDTGAVRASIAIGGLVPSSLAALAPVLKPLAGFTLPVSGRVSLTADRAGRIGDVDFDLAGGAGEIAVPGLALAPVAVRDLALTGSARDDFHDLIITRALLDLPDFQAQASGELSFGADGVGVKLDASAPLLATDALGRYWPTDVAVHARDWIVSRISGGSVSNIVLHVALMPGALKGAVPLPPDAVRLDFAYSGLNLNYLSGLPPLTAGKGVARLTQSTLEMTGITGKSAGLDLKDGKVVITGIDQKDQTATITFAASGRLADALALLDRPPLHFITPMGLKPASVGGHAEVEAKFVLPLKHDLTFAEIKVSAKAKLRDASVPKIAGRFSLAKGDLTLGVDTSHLDMKGQAALAGVPLTLDWRENFAAAAPFRSRYHLNGTITEAGRAELGFDTAPYVRGPVAADVVIETSRKGAVKIDGRFGLDAARLALSQAHWAKPAGVAGTAEVHLSIPRAGITNLSGFTLVAGDLRTRGSGAFDTKGLKRLELEPLVFGRNDLGLKINRASDGGYHIDLGGKELDLEPVLDQNLFSGDKSAAKTDQEPALDVDVHLGVLRFGAGRVIRDVFGHFLRRNGRIEQAALTGRLDPRARILARVDPKDGKRRLSVTTDDAGALVKVAGVTDDIVGGSFALDATIDDRKPGHPAAGQMVMHKFKLVKAPVLARLLTIASLSGIGEILSGQGIAFDLARFPFTTSGSKLVIKGGLGHGAALGFTLDGSLDQTAGTADLGGTLVPSYRLNTLPGKLPLIGRLLTSRPGEGVFGITYSVTGPIRNPKVSVNPLSALAPGILRRIFELGNDGTPAAPAGPMKSGIPGMSVPNAAPPPQKKPDVSPSAGTKGNAE